jgi:hypothetical protein
MVVVVNFMRVVAGGVGTPGAEPATAVPFAMKFAAVVGSNPMFSPLPATPPPGIIVGFVNSTKVLIFSSSNCYVGGKACRFLRLSMRPGGLPIARLILPDLAPPLIFADHAPPGTCRHSADAFVNEAIDRLHGPRVFSHAGGGHYFRHAPGHEISADSVGYFDRLTIPVGRPVAQKSHEHFFAPYGVALAAVLAARSARTASETVKPSVASL